MADNAKKRKVNIYEEPTSVNPAVFFSDSGGEASDEAIDEVLALRRENAKMKALVQNITTFARDVMTQYPQTCELASTKVRTHAPLAAFFLGGGGLGGSAVGAASGPSGGGGASGASAQGPLIVLDE